MGAVLKRSRVYRQSDGRKWSQWEIIAPITYISCCDCGLVHTNQFRVIRGRLVMRVKRFEKATRNLRSKKQFVCKPLDKRRKPRSKKP